MTPGDAVLSCLRAGSKWSFRSGSSGPNSTAHSSVRWIAESARFRAGSLLSIPCPVRSNRVAHAAGYETMSCRLSRSRGLLSRWNRIRLVGECVWRASNRERESRSPVWHRLSRLASDGGPCRRGSGIRVAGDATQEPNVEQHWIRGERLRLIVEQPSDRCSHAVYVEHEVTRREATGPRVQALGEEAEVPFMHQDARAGIAEDGLVPSLCLDGREVRGAGRG